MSRAGSEISGARGETKIRGPFISILDNFFCTTTKTLISLPNSKSIKHGLVEAVLRKKIVGKTKYERKKIKIRRRHREVGLLD